MVGRAALTPSSHAELCWTDMSLGVMFLLCLWQEGVPGLQIFPGRLLLSWRSMHVSAPIAPGHLEFAATLPRLWLGLTHRISGPSTCPLWLWVGAGLGPAGVGYQGRGDWWQFLEVPSQLSADSNHSYFQGSQPKPNYAQKVTVPLQSLKLERE